MGEKDIATKRYIQQSDKFADLCNYYLFDGRSVIKPDELEDKNILELGLPFANGKGAAVEKLRDVLKRCVVKTSDSVVYMIVGVENQSEVHYAMVVRNMLYDALNYTSQVEACAKKHYEDKDLQGAEYLSGFSKNDTLIPVVTITVYWNSGVWDGPRSLHDMFGTKNEQILKYVPDFWLNLIVPYEIESFDKFETDLKDVFSYIKSSDSKEKIKNLYNGKVRWMMRTETVRFLNETINAGLEVNEKGEWTDLCKGMKELREEIAEEARVEWREKGHAEGLAEGHAEGLAEGTLQTLLSLVKDNLITIEIAANRANMSLEEFEQAYQSYK